MKPKTIFQKKRAAVLAAILCVCLLFSACSARENEDAPISVNGTPVDAEIFRYYLDAAFNDLSLADRTARINYATEQCIRYVALNTAFVGMGLSLSPAARAEIGETGNALWRVFGAHYEKVGVSKQTYMKLRTNLAYAETLRAALYDEGGKTPISDEELKSYFASHYVAVRYLDGYLYMTDADGTKKMYDENTRKAIFERFEKNASRINAGAAAELMYASLSNEIGIDVQQHLSTEVVKAKQAGYPKTFYEAVCGLEIGKAGVLLFGDHIYGVFRESVLADETLFRNYRAECLLAVSETPLQNEISRLCEGFTSVRQPRVAQACYAAVSAGRRNA